MFDSDLAIIYFILGVVVLFINMYLAYQFYEVAKEKGYAETKYFVIPFIFTIPGYLLIIALPNKNAPISSTVKKVSKDLPEL